MNQILTHDVSKGLPFPDKIAQTCTTSPPYFGLRDYGTDPSDWPEISYTPMVGLPPITIPAMRASLGLEESPLEFVGHLVHVLRDVWRVLRDDGTLWLNMGDTYSGGGRGGNGDAITGRGKNASQLSHRTFGVPAKNRMGIPWRVALALQGDGWILRQGIIWNKPNPMPESVDDRCTNSHEDIFILTKQGRYYFDAAAIKEPAKDPGAGKTWDQRKEMGFKGNTKHPTKDAIEAGLSIPSLRASRDGVNRRSVWTVATQPYSGAHFATFPPDLIRPCILAGSRPGDIVLDPFMGSGTTAQVAMEEGRQYIGTELNPGYQPLYQKRLWAVSPGLGL